jgi:hypothetical protein
MTQMMQMLSKYHLKTSASLMAYENRSRVKTEQNLTLFRAYLNVNFKLKFKLQI